MDKYILKRRIGKNEATPEIKVTTLQGEIKFKKVIVLGMGGEDGKECTAISQGPITPADVLVFQKLFSIGLETLANEMKKDILEGIRDIVDSQLASFLEDMDHEL